MPHRLELCNVVCSWGRIERARRDPVADEFEIVLVDAEDGILAKAGDQSVRDRQRQQQHDRRGLVGQCGQDPADFAGDDERAVRRAEPILGHTSSTASSTSSSSTSSSSTRRDAALKDLFSQIDGDGDGKITKSEFENALGAGGTNLAQADDVFSKLDSNSDGSVSLDEMSKALKSGHHGHHHAQGAGDASGSGSNSSSPSSGGSTSTSTTGADGSTTTTVTYADGFKMSTTVPGRPPLPLIRRTICSRS